MFLLFYIYFCKYLYLALIHFYSIFNCFNNLIVFYFTWLPRQHFSILIIYFLVFQLYFNDQKPFFYYSSCSQWWQHWSRCCIYLFMNENEAVWDRCTSFTMCLSEPSLSRNCFEKHIFNVASAEQSWAKIKSVGQTSNPHSLIYIPKKLNETSRQRSFILS